MTVSLGRRLGGLTLAITLLAAGAAHAATPTTRVVTMNGYSAPGTPAELNKVKVIQIGQPRAKHVLVLVPGTSGGGPYFAPVARDIVRRLPGWQVWSIERRENLLEDQSVLQQVATMPGVALFHRFDLMRGWASDGRLDLERVRKPEREKAVTLLNTCLGNVLAAFMLSGAEQAAAEQAGSGQSAR